MVHDFENFEISRNSRGGNLTNIILNTYAKNFLGVDPIDSAPPMSGSSDPQYHILLIVVNFMI